jgi:hypothetical protein
MIKFVIADGNIFRARGAITPSRVDIMSRDLSERDWQILKKLAPEMPEGRKYRSILPPLSKFYAASEEDFARRIEMLSDSELDYLVGLVENGQECLTCLAPSYKGAFVALVGRRMPAERAQKLKKLIDFLSTME